MVVSGDGYVYGEGYVQLCVCIYIYMFMSKYKDRDDGVELTFAGVGCGWGAKALRRGERFQETQSFRGLRLRGFGFRV